MTSPFGAPQAADNLTFQVQHQPHGGEPILLIRVGTVEIKGQVTRDFLRHLADMFVREADVSERVDAIVQVSPLRAGARSG